MAKKSAAIAKRTAKSATGTDRIREMVDSLNRVSVAWDAHGRSLKDWNTGGRPQTGHLTVANERSGKVLVSVILAARSIAEGIRDNLGSFYANPTRKERELLTLLDDSYHRMFARSISSIRVPSVRYLYDRLLAMIDDLRCATDDNAVSDKGQLTVTEAAKRLQANMSHLNLTLQQAMARVSHAKSDNKFQHKGLTGRASRIDPVSFDAWLLKLRNADLDKEDR